MDLPPGFDPGPADSESAVLPVKLREKEHESGGVACEHPAAGRSSYLSVISSRSVSSDFGPQVLGPLRLRQHEPPKGDSDGEADDKSEHASDSLRRSERRLYLYRI